MKAPAQIDALSLAGHDFATGGAYPPLGFRPVLDAELGNGDYFGLYWPYGREGRDPIPGRLGLAFGMRGSDGR